MACLELLPYCITMDSAYVVAAGWGAHADWYQNVLANPEVMVQVGKRCFAVRAHLVEEPEAQKELVGQLVRQSWHLSKPPRPVRWLLRTVFSYDHDAVLGDGAREVRFERAIG